MKRNERAQYTNNMAHLMSDTNRRPKAIRTVSLFSGCGGTDIALQASGYKIVLANDIWDKACDTYRDNLKKPAIECGDIRDIKKFKSADLLVGCYPCQGFTQGGRRDWDAPVNFLYREFARALDQINPKAFIVENVIGMTFGANKLRLADQLERYGKEYVVQWKVLNAKHYGVAQNRRRVFIVGIRKDCNFRYSFPNATHGPDASQMLLTQEQAFRGLRAPKPGEYNDEPLHWYYLSRRRRCNWDEPSPCIVGHWRHVPLHPLSPPLERVTTDEWRFEHDGPVRRMSYGECAALQGFPPEYLWNHGTIREKFQMIGNAVPPPLFSAVVNPLTDLWN